jgi:hypothetical protein
MILRTNITLYTFKPIRRAGLASCEARKIIHGFFQRRCNHIARVVEGRLPLAFEHANRLSSARAMRRCQSQLPQQWDKTH